MLCRPRAALLIFVAAASVTACKSAAPRSPNDAPRLDDLASIEDALERNAVELRGQGIAIRAQPAAPATPPPKPEPERENSATIEPPTEASDDDRGIEELEPDLAPAPAPAPAPAEKSEGRTILRRRSSRSRRAERKDQADRCERRCDLAAATCDLAHRICNLANEHVDDVRYEDACERAELQCESAADACNDCS